MKKLLLGVASAALIYGAAAPALASTSQVQFTYVADAGSPALANLLVTYDDALNVRGFHDLVSITGDIDGDTGFTLVSNPSNPFAFNDGNFIFDQQHNPIDPFITNAGWLLDSALFRYNVFATNEGQAGSKYEIYKALPTGNGGQYLANSSGNGRFENVPGIVPEPASWALMILGFGGIGATLRKRRVSTTFA